MITENKALGLAPLITPFAFALYAFYADIPGFNMDDGILTFIGLFMGLLVASLPVAYIYMFFIGGRLYGILKRKRRVNIVTLTLGSVFIADIPMLFIWPLAEEGFYLTLQLFSFVGFMIGLSFWFLLNFDRLHEKFKRLLGK